MSLFVCMECKCIENSNLVHHGVDKDLSKPNMWLMDMQGCGSHIVTTNLEVVERTAFYNKGSVKEPEDILMLCSECNTGTWHGEFDKDIASYEELAMASFSKYNMITPYDHKDGILIKDNSKPHGYGLDYNSKLLDTSFWMKHQELINNHPNFVLTEDLVDDNNPERGITINGRNSNKVAMMQLAALYTMFGGSSGSDPRIDLFRSFRSKRQTNNTDEKTIEDTIAINKANLKRQIKELKRSKTDPELLEKLQNKYNELRENHV